MSSVRLSMKPKFHQNTDGTVSCLRLLYTRLAVLQAVVQYIPILHSSRTALLIRTLNSKRSTTPAAQNAYHAFNSYHRPSIELSNRIFMK